MEESSDNDKSRKMKRLAYAMLMFTIIQLIIYYAIFSGFSFWPNSTNNLSFIATGIVICAPQSLIMLGPAFYSLFIDPKKIFNTFKFWFFLFVVGSAWSVWLIFAFNQE